MTVRLQYEILERWNGNHFGNSVISTGITGTLRQVTKPNSASITRVNTFERAAPRRDHVDVEVSRAQGRGHLEADEARTEHHRPPRALGGPDDRAGVVERPEVVNVGAGGIGDRQPYGFGARRKHDRAELPRRAVVEHEALGSGSERGRPPPEQQLHSELLVIAARMKRHPLLGRGAGQILLGEVGPIVRSLLVRVDQGDAQVRRLQR